MFKLYIQVDFSQDFEHAEGTRVKKKKKINTQFHLGWKISRARLCYSRVDARAVLPLSLPARVFPWRLRNVNTGRKNTVLPSFAVRKNMADPTVRLGETPELGIKRKQPSQGVVFSILGPMFEIVNPIFLPPPPPPPFLRAFSIDRRSRTESEVSSFHVHNTPRETTGRVM